jgi:hypothetical protein
MTQEELEQFIDYLLNKDETAETLKEQENENE